LDAEEDRAYQKGERVFRIPSFAVKLMAGERA